MTVSLTLILITKIEDQHAIIPRKDLVNGFNNFGAKDLPGDGPENSQFRKRKWGDVDKTNDDSTLQEFLGVMQPPSKSRTWQNEDLAGAEEPSKLSPVIPLQKAEADQSDEEYEAVPEQVKRPRTLEGMESTGNIQLDPVQTENSNVVEHVAGRMSEPPMDSVPAASDEDWLRSRTSRLLGLVDDDDVIEPRPLLQTVGDPIENPVIPKSSQDRKMSDAGVQTDEEALTPNIAAPEQTNADSSKPVANTARLFVRNLVYTATSNDLQEHFEAQKYGSIEEV